VLTQFLHRTPHECVGSQHFLSSQCMMWSLWMTVVSCGTVRMHMQRFCCILCWWWCCRHALCCISWTGEFRGDLSSKAAAVYFSSPVFLNIYLACMLLPSRMEHVSQKNLWKLFSFVKLLHLAVFIWIDLTVPQSIQTSSGAHPVAWLVVVGGSGWGVTLTTHLHLLWGL
jgi:hypothetical protein